MIRHTGTALVLIAALLVVLVLGVLSSTAGNRLILSWAEDFLAPALSVEGLDGSILSRLCADSVRFEVPAVSVVVTDVCVAPELWASIDFLKVHLTVLDAGRVAVQTRPTPGEAEAGALLLPVALMVDRLRVGELDVNDILVRQIRAVLDLSDANLAVAGTFDFQSWPAEVATSGPWNSFRVQLRALNASADATVDLTGTDLPWSLSLNSTEFDLEPFADRPVLLSDVTLTGSGNLSGYAFEVRSGVQDPAFNAGVSGRGSGDWDGLRMGSLEVTEASLDALPNARIRSLTSRGRLRWAGGFQADLEAVSASGRIIDYGLEAALDELHIDTQRVRMASAVLWLDGNRESSASVDGTIDFGSAVDLDVTVRALPLDMIDGRAAGTADARASVRGALSNPEVDGQFDVSALTWFSEPVGEVRGELHGTLEKGRLALRLEAEQGTLDADIDYADTAGSLNLAVQRAVVAYPRLEAIVELDEPANVELHAGAIRLEETCLTLRSSLLEAAPGKLCGALDYPRGGLTLSLQPWRMPTIPLADNLLSVTGVAGMDLTLDSFSPLAGRADIQLTELAARQPDMPTLALGELSATVRIDNGEARVVLETPEGREQELLLRGDMLSTLASEVELSPVSGSLYLELDGIWVAQSLLPMDIAFELEDVRGVMGIDATVDGTLGEPILNGTLILRDAGWQVLALNARFNDFRLDADLADSDHIRFTSGGEVGAGRLDLSGHLEGMRGEDPRLITEFTLDRAAVINLPDYRAVVNGTLKLGMGSEDLSLTGQLRLPEADILIADLPETAVTVSADEVLVDEGAAASAQQLRTTDLELHFGDDVQLEAFGLTARLSGSLRLQESPGRLRSVTGVINLRDGKFEAYGQALDVERGQLTFTGQVDNPTVDVIATREITYEDRDYRISLLITGTAQSLRTAVRSQPAMSEDDALALLITGRTFSQISSSEQSNVSGAAISMGLLSATGITKNLASRLNLEEIIVDQDAEGNMEVGAAVQLNRDLYLRYTYGVFSRLGGVLVRYRFSKRFSVQAITGDAHSIELRYGVDD